MLLQASNTFLCIDGNSLEDLAGKWSPGGLLVCVYFLGAFGLVFLVDLEGSFSFFQKKGHWWFFLNFEETAMKIFLSLPTVQPRLCGNIPVGDLIFWKLSSDSCLFLVWIFSHLGIALIGVQKLLGYFLAALNFRQLAVWFYQTLYVLKIALWVFGKISPVIAVEVFKWFLAQHQNGFNYLMGHSCLFFSGWFKILALGGEKILMQHHNFSILVYPALLNAESNLRVLGQE